MEIHKFTLYSGNKKTNSAVLLAKCNPTSMPNTVIAQEYLRGFKFKLRSSR